MNKVQTNMMTERERRTAAAAERAEEHGLMVEPLRALRHDCRLLFGPPGAPHLCALWEIERDLRRLDAERRYGRRTRFIAGPDGEVREVVPEPERKAA